MAAFRARRVAAVAVVAGALASGCGAAGDPTGVLGGNQDAEVRVATTTNFITDTVEQIGGSRVSVEGLMGPGVDPHLYKASAGDVETLREADVIFYGGLLLEGKMSEVLAELSAEVPAVAVSEAVPEDRLLDPPVGAAPEEEHDPHVWFDPESWKFAATAIRDELIEIDPEGKAEYEANTDRFLAEIDRLVEEGKSAFAEVPAGRRVLITSHDAFAYFGRTFGLEVFGIQGISTASEATTADIDRIADVIAEREIPAVFVESSVPRQTIDAVVAAAEQRGQEVSVGGELFSDAAGDEGTPDGTYIGMVRANIETISEALR